MCRRTGARILPTFLDDVSVNGLGGWFAVVSQMSPTGGKDFEDMALVDPSDPDQWLLVVAVVRADLRVGAAVGGRLPDLLFAALRRLDEVELRLALGLERIRRQRLGAPASLGVPYVREER